MILLIIMRNNEPEAYKPKIIFSFEKTLLLINNMLAKSAPGIGNQWFKAY